MFLLQINKVVYRLLVYSSFILSLCCVLHIVTVMSDSDPMDRSPRGFSVHGDSPGKNIKNGLPCPPPGDLPNLGITPTSPALQESVHSLPKMWILYQLSHLGSPRILMWVAYPLPRGSSQPRNRTGVSSVARRFFTN